MALPVAMVSPELAFASDLSFAGAEESPVLVISNRDPQYWFSRLANPNVMPAHGAGAARSIQQSKAGFLVEDHTGRKFLTQKLICENLVELNPDHSACGIDLGGKRFPLTFHSAQTVKARLRIHRENAISSPKFVDQFLNDEMPSILCVRTA